MVGTLGAGNPPEWTAALGVPKAERDPLGRWSAEGSDTYVRSYRALVKRLVAMFVAKARAAEGYQDLDEEDGLLDVRRLFARKRVDGPAGEAEVQRLLDISKRHFTSCAVVVPDEAAHKVDEEQFQEVIDEKPIMDEEEANDYEFIVALAGRGRKATLHRRGGCWRARRLSFTSYELVAGPGAPAEGAYDHRCRDCWQMVKALAEKPGEANSSSTASSSSSESSVAG